MNLPSGHEDDAGLVAELARHDVRARWVPWTGWEPVAGDPLVVLRSTWDYTSQRADFLQWVNSLSRVANPADVVGWNTDKTYLRDLATAGVPTVPTVFAEPGAQVTVPDAPEIVVKPSVGAGSRGAGRFARSAADAAVAHAQELQRAGRTAMIQPYLEGVDADGETALLYFDGRFSHAIRKGPMLPADTAHALHSYESFVPETISARAPDAAQLDVGAAVIGALRDRFGAAPLYARIDLLPGAAGPVVVEVELTEPSLFFGHAKPADDGSTALSTFAAAIAARA
ncbi:RimK family alpha-L-glutamate ligase [uncultured Jatrophihabitans sp.]|uniref:ATP-grasp domain-containing protein n=1 Tax=uncultured Jatrophihabitans sp. TaxID=1610747 RepID=UPI0035CC2BFA